MNKGNLGRGLTQLVTRDLVKEKTGKREHNLVQKRHRLSCRNIYPTVVRNRIPHSMCGIYYIQGTNRINHSKYSTPKRKTSAVLNVKYHGKYLKRLEELLINTKVNSKLMQFTGI